jgi:YHS domain-containing protein
MVRLISFLIEFLFVVLVWRLLGRVLQSVFGESRMNPSSRSGRNSPGNGGAATVHGKTARDPVCGMFVSTELSHRLQQDGRTLHFCSRECLERYLGKQAEGKGRESGVSQEAAEKG